MVVERPETLLRDGERIAVLRERPQLFQCLVGVLALACVDEQLPHDASIEERRSNRPLSHGEILRAVAIRAKDHRGAVLESAPAHDFPIPIDCVKS